VARYDAEKRFQIFANLPYRPTVADGPALAPASVQDGEVELRLVCVESREKVKHLVQHFLGACVVAVDFVDKHYGFEAEFERFGEYELCLRQGALRGVDKQDDAVYHAEDALHFAAEVCAKG
jgi:hypothetical protein